jgi:hypothetical protein
LPAPETSPPAVEVALLTVPPTTFPTWLTAEPSPALTPESLLATVPTTPLIVEPTELPVPVTAVPTAPVALSTVFNTEAVGDDAEQPELHDPEGGEVVPVGETVTGATWETSGLPATAIVVPMRAAPPCVIAPGTPVVRGVVPVVVRAAGVVAAATRRLSARDAAGTWCGGVDTTSAAGAAVLATCGQPRNATTALAVTNTSAAPATSDPAVPKPATYARVARITRVFIGSCRDIL